MAYGKVKPGSQKSKKKGASKRDAPKTEKTSGNPPATQFNTPHMDKSKVSGEKK